MQSGDDNEYEEIQFKDQMISGDSPSKLFGPDFKDQVRDSKRQARVVKHGRQPNDEEILYAQEVQHKDDASGNGHQSSPSRCGLSQTVVLTCGAVLIVALIVIGVVVGVVLSQQDGSPSSATTITTSTPPTSLLPTLAPSIQVSVGPPTMSPVMAPPIPMPSVDPVDVPIVNPTTMTIPTDRPSLRPTFAPPTPGSSQMVFMSTIELYEAVDLYVVNPVATLKYGASISDWDVSRIANFDSLFDVNRNTSPPCDTNCIASTINADLSRWNVSRAVSMRNMFQYATQFNGDISTWNVEKVTSTRNMFRFARAFNRDLGQWNVNNVNDMNLMFDFATMFNQNIANWNVSRVQGMNQMFAHAESFNHDIANWNVGSTIDTRYMFAGANAFNQDLCQWTARLPQTTNVLGMFSGVFSDFAGPARSCPTSDDPSLPNGPMCHECL